MQTEAVLSLMQDVAGEVINPRFRALRQAEVREKNPGDLVTVADQEAEELLTRALLSAYPEALVLGEEACSANPAVLESFRAAEHAFTVDPVDGTKNFVNGSPDHAVMVSELRAGTVVRGWIWQPQHQTAYVAELGSGAWRIREGNAIRLRREPPAGEPSAWRGVTSRRSWLDKSLPGMAPLALTWVCCGMDYPKLIEGEADYVLYGGTKRGAGRPWDHAPGSLLVNEAGGFAGATSPGQSTADVPYDPVGDSDVLIAAASREAFDVLCASGRQPGSFWR